MGASIERCLDIGPKRFIDDSRLFAVILLFAVADLSYVYRALESRSRDIAFRKAALFFFFNAAAVDTFGNMMMNSFPLIADFAHHQRNPDVNFFAIRQDAVR